MPLFLGCLLAAASAVPGSTHDLQLLDPADAFRLEASRPEARRVQLRWTIAEGYYLYRARLRVHAGQPPTTLAPALPPGRVKDDPFFGPTEIYREGVTIDLELDAQAAAREAVTLEVVSQGCADIGICFPPESRQLTLRVGQSAQPAPSAPFTPLPLIGGGALKDPARRPE